MRPSYNLQEVVATGAAASRNSTLFLWNGTEYAEFGIEVFAHVHDGGNVSAPIAIIRRRPDRNNGFLGKVILDLLEYFLYRRFQIYTL